MGIVNTLDDPGEHLSPVEREGFAWVELLISGEATKEDLAACERWCEQSALHKQAFALAVRLRRAVTQPDVYAAKPYLTPIWDRETTRRSVLIAAVGTIGLAGYGLAKPPLGLWPSLAELTSDYRTSTGERRAVALADGVSLDMNGRTSVSLRSKPGQPGIELVAGEIAVFTALSKNFTVIAGSRRISAAHAEYDVRLDESGFCVSCLKGTLQLATDQTRITLGALEQVRGKASGFSDPVRIDPIVVTAWQHGRLIFHDTPLSDVVTEINRYRPGKIVIANTNLAQSRFSGDFRVDRIDQAVREVARVANATATPLVGGILVLS